MHRNTKPLFICLCLAVATSAATYGATLVAKFHENDRLETWAERRACHVEFQSSLSSEPTGGWVAKAFGEPVAFRDRMTNITVDDLVTLSKFDSLKTLSFGCDDVNAAGWQAIGRLRNLEELCVMCNGDPRGVNVLPTLQHLRRLTIYVKGMRGDDYRFLRKLKRLEDICLWNSDVDNSVISHLSGLKNLRSVSLSTTNVSDSGVRQLVRDHPRLRLLMLNGARIDGACFDAVRGLKQLEYFSCHGISQSERDKFRTELPGCDVSW